MEEVQNTKPETPQKQNYIKLPKRLAVVAVLVLMIILIAGVFAAGLMFGRLHSSTVSITANSTPTLTPAISVVPVKTVPTFPTSSNPNLIRFTSEKLGVTFTYLRSQQQQTISAQEIGNKVYVYFDKTQPTTGQYLTVFDKDKNQTLEQAIRTQILKGYSSTDCLIKPQTQYVPKGFNALMIVVPVGQDDSMESIQAKVEKCPAGYTAMGGMAYFVEDPAHPDKMIFLSIGQYLINSEGDNQGWQNTLQLF